MRSQTKDITFDSLKMQVDALAAVPIETDVTVSPEIFETLWRLDDDNLERSIFGLVDHSKPMLRVHVDKTFGENEWHFGKPKPKSKENDYTCPKCTELNIPAPCIHGIYAKFEVASEVK